MRVGTQRPRPRSCSSPPEPSEQLAAFEALLVERGAPIAASWRRADLARLRERHLLDCLRAASVCPSAPDRLRPRLRRRPPRHRGRHRSPGAPVTLSSAPATGRPSWSSAVEAWAWRTYRVVPGRVEDAHGAASTSASHGPSPLPAPPGRRRNRSCCPEGGWSTSPANVRSAEDCPKGSCRACSARRRLQGRGRSLS